MKRLVISFLLLLPLNLLAAPVTVDRLEASVNASLILMSDVVKFRESMPLRAQLDPLFAGTAVAAKGAKVEHKDIVDYLIDEKLIALQFPVTDAEVESEINSIQANNKIGREQLKSALKDQGFAFGDYFDLIRTSAAKRNLIDRDIRTKVTISDDDVKNYFYNHYAKSSSSPRAYKVKIITVNPSNYKTPVAAREIAERAVKSIRGGETFEDVARRVSDDPSKENGGDLGTLTEDQMAPAIRDQLKKMDIGQVSGILGTPQTSFFIVKLSDVASSESDRLEKMKDEIRSQLAASEYQHQIQLWLDRQRQSSFIHHAGDSSVAGLNVAH